MPLYPRSSWVLRYESRFSDPILSKRRDDRPSAGPTSSAICGAPLVGPLLKSPPPIRTLPDSERSARGGRALSPPPPPPPNPPPQGGREFQRSIRPSNPCPQRCRSSQSSAICGLSKLRRFPQPDRRGTSTAMRSERSVTTPK